MARSRALNRTSESSVGVAFLLSQVGAHAAAKFAERLEPLELKPAHVGILQVIKKADGLNQQVLGETLGVFPSRLVSMLDELEQRGLVERRNSPSDRRSYALYLTDTGRDIVERVGRIALEHQNALCAALDDSERQQLAGFLSRIAAEQGLTPGVHPGFRKLGGSDAPAQ